MRASEILAKLKSMASKVGEMIWERTSLAATALDDDDWIMAEFSGDKGKAIETLEADYFPELSKAFGLSQLLVLYREFPTKEAWKEHKYNLMRLWAEHESREIAARGDKPKIERHVVKLKDLEVREEKIKELEWSLKQAREMITVKETEEEKVRREIAELRAINSELVGENRSLLRMIENMRRERVAV